MIGPGGIPQQVLPGAGGIGAPMMGAPVPGGAPSVIGAGGGLNAGELGHPWAHTMSPGMPSQPGQIGRMQMNPMPGPMQVRR